MIQRYITEIHLEDFQDHKNTKITFKSGLNLITGSSDAGKSAILRAINFVCHNLPRGKSFVRRGAKEARVTLTFSDGTSVQRIKGDRNAYVTQSPTGILEAFDAIGNNIPLAVQKALGNPPIDDKHGPLSYAEQMSPLFLVSLSPTDLPRALSELTGIDDLEEAAQLLSKRSRTAANQAKDSENRVKQHTKDLEQYQGLDDKIQVMEEIGVRFSDLDCTAKEIQGAKHLLERYRDVINHGKEAFKALSMAKKISVFSGRIVPLKDAGLELEKANRVLSQYQDCNKKIMESEKSLSKAKSILCLSTRIAALKETSAIISAANSALAELNNIDKRINNLTSEKNTWHKTIQEKQQEKIALIGQMRTDGLWCDSCGRPLEKPLTGIAQK